MTVSVLLTCALLVSAPAPFTKTQRVKALTAAQVVGKWEATWAGHKCSITLSPDGSYACKWFSSNYVGHWYIGGKNILVVSESSNVGELSSWKTYTIRLDPLSLRGNVIRGIHSGEKFEPGGIDVRFISHQFLTTER